MRIDLEKLTLKAKEDLLKTILAGIENRVSWSGDDLQDKEEVLDYILVDLLHLLDNGDNDDFWGTEGWQHQFGLA